jgi:repressor LexA
MNDLTPKQLEVFTFIQLFLKKHSFPPTRGEIAQGLGLRNRQGIDQHLRALEVKGAIKLIPGISRGIRIREASLPAISHVSLATTLAAETTLPLLGRIAAGSPTFATGNIEEHVNVDAALFRPRASFLLRVRGDSMKDADILDRDLLAVHQTTEVRNGQIVVARLGEEATVKYYQRHGHIVRLEPANTAYKPIEVDLRKKEISLEGIAVGIIRTALSRAR